MNHAVAFRADMGAVYMGDDTVVGETVKGSAVTDGRVEAGRLLVGQFVQPLHPDRTSLGTLDGRSREMPDAVSRICSVGKRGRSVSGNRGVGNYARFGSVVVGQQPAGAAGTVTVDPGIVGRSKGETGCGIDQAAAAAEDTRQSQLLLELLDRD